MEDWLTPLSRKLWETGGQPIELEQSKLFWEYFDYLVGNKFFTERQLVQAGDKVTEVYGLPFPLAMQDAVAHLYNDWHDG